MEALGNTERYQSHTRTVDDHSTESVGGIKTLEALGALKLLSGGSASLAAVDDLQQATGRDLNLVVGQKHNDTVGGDMEERIQGLRKRVAAVSQRLVAPKSHVGSEPKQVLSMRLCALSSHDMTVFLQVMMRNAACYVACYVRQKKQRPASLQAFVFKWCRHQESNPGPTDYKSVALPTELYRRVRATIIAIGKHL